jgi:hypothetical protein
MRQAQYLGTMKLKLENTTSSTPDDHSPPPEKDDVTAMEDEDRGHSNADEEAKPRYCQNFGATTQPSRPSSQLTTAYIKATTPHI